MRNRRRSSLCKLCAPCYTLLYLLYSAISPAYVTFCRQWDEEQKARQPKANTLVEQDDLGSDDGVSTVGGVLHEEHFAETKAGPGAGAGQDDVEAPHGSSQDEEGLLAVLKIVDWWKVCSICTLFHTVIFFGFVVLVSQARPSCMVLLAGARPANC